MNDNNTTTTTSSGETTTTTTLNGNMGLRGIWAQVANMTAVLLICVVFYQDRHSAMDSAREDRQMFQTVMHDLREDCHRQWRSMREDSQRQWEAIRNALVKDKGQP